MILLFPNSESPVDFICYEVLVVESNFNITRRFDDTFR